MKGIYKIVNLETNKIYIGSSNDMLKRCKQHFSDLKNNTHRNSHLQASYNKYGILNFKFEILEICEQLNKYELLEKEQEYINSFNRNELYNLTYITNGGGADVLSIEVYLLDLNGKIIIELPSISETSRFLKRKLLSQRCNNNCIICGKYRLVSKKFYYENLETILSWKNYNSEIKEKNRLNKLKKKIILIENNKTLEFDNSVTLSKYLNISRERVRQILEENNKKKFNINYKYPELRNGRNM
jgi:group I intron endonuclease